MNIYSYRNALADGRRIVAVELASAGLCATDIARCLAINVKTVLGILAREGMTTRSKEAAQQRAIRVGRERMALVMAREGYSRSDIARAIGLRPGGVGGICERNGIRTNGSSERALRKRNATVKKLYGLSGTGQVVAHKKRALAARAGWPGATNATEVAILEYLMGGNRTNSQIEDHLRSTDGKAPAKVERITKKLATTGMIEVDGIVPARGKGTGHFSLLYRLSNSARRNKMMAMDATINSKDGNCRLVGEPS